MSASFSNSFGEPSKFLWQTKYCMFQSSVPDEKNALGLLDNSGNHRDLWVERSFDIVNYEPR